jgi:xanthine/uracil permease
MNVSFRRRSAFAVGILFVTFVSWFRGTAVTYFPNTEEGNAKFSFFSQVVAVQPVNLIVGQFTSKLNDVILALITMLYVDFLDTTGTLYGLAKSLDFIDKDGNFPRSRLAFAIDGIGAIVASIFGMSSVTAYIESAAGVEVGGRTDLTAVVTGFLFFLAIFFSPLLASIPPWATGGTLVIVRGSIPLYLFLVSSNLTVHFCVPPLSFHSNVTGGSTHVQIFSRYQLARSSSCHICIRYNHAHATDVLYIIWAHWWFHGVVFNAGRVPHHEISVQS